MVSADRQQIIETNRSLRVIKNELENLLEKGAIDDAAYDSIHSLLPAEGSLHGGAAANRATPSTASSPAPPTNGLANLNLGQQQQPSQPPSYSQSTPALPQRAQPPPPPAPAKNILTHATALYRYAGTDARDLSFERDDTIAVHEYMNDDWWMGRNERTGQEGIFPRNYVQPKPAPAPTYTDEKAGYNSYAHQQNQQQQQQPVPNPNPYNSHVPPMAVAEQPAQQGGAGGSGKTGEYGKKFGKKLGNAAIFGAGATLGGNLVNSIF